MKKRFYKNQYFFALYDKDDFLFDIADNINELLKLDGCKINRKNMNRMCSKVSHALDNENSKIIVRGHKVSIYTIPISEEEA